jgi:hypothetical protein
MVKDYMHCRKKHYERINPESGTNSNSSTWNYIFSARFCTRYEQDLPSVYAMDGKKKSYNLIKSTEKQVRQKT